MARSSPAMTKRGWFRHIYPSDPACFPALLAPNKDREIGGGRATRQPGQVRKEAALTRSGSGRSSVSYSFFRANRAWRGLARPRAFVFPPVRKPALRDNPLRIDR